MKINVSIKKPKLSRGFCYARKFRLRTDALRDNSGVTPMGSGWANPRAPGSEGAHSSVPAEIAFSKRCPFPTLFFHSLVAKFP